MGKTATASADDPPSTPFAQVSIPADATCARQIRIQSLWSRTRSMAKTRQLCIDLHEVVRPAQARSLPMHNVLSKRDIA